MSGISPTGSPFGPEQLRRLDKDGRSGGGGGGYTPNRRPKRDHQDDEASISEEAQAALASTESNRHSAIPGHVVMQSAAEARPEAADARLEILSEINHFNELHQRSGSAFKATIRLLGQRNVLHIEDRSRGVDIKPFGDTDVYHHAVPALRSKLEAFDHSSGSLFDGRV